MGGSEKPALSLDIGCGATKRADIGLDLCIHDGVDILADGQHLPIRSCSIQQVYSSDTIEHVDNPGLFLREISRVLTPDGMATLKYPRREWVNTIKNIAISDLLAQYPFVLVHPVWLHYALRNLYRAWRRDPRAYHRYWPSLAFVAQYLHVDSVSSSTPVPVWIWLTFGRKGSWFKFLKRLNTPHMELVLVCRKFQ